MAGAVAIGVGLLALIWIFVRPLGLVIIGLTIAAALLPVANWLGRWMPRDLAVILIYLLIGLVLAALIGVIFPPLVDQTQQAAEQTQISPLLALVAVVLGESVGGIVGILVAIPLAAALRVLFLEVVVPAFRRWTGATKPEQREAERLPKGAVPVAFSCGPARESLGL